MFGKKTKQVIRVEGMHCQHCAARVEKALLALDGVKKVDVDLDGKLATIVAKAPLGEEALNQAITNAGFKFGGLAE